MSVYTESKNLFKIHKIFWFQLALLQNYPKTVLRFAKKDGFLLISRRTRSQGTKSVSFSVATANGEYRKPEFKIKRRG